MFCLHTLENAQKRFGFLTFSKTTLYQTIVRELKDGDLNAGEAFSEKVLKKYFLNFQKMFQSCLVLITGLKVYSEMAHYLAA